MPLHFHVENLGKIKSGNFTICPLTVITGPNGTGKSFFTKTIYSIFKVMEQATTLKSIRILTTDLLEYADTLEEFYNENEGLREKLFLHDTINHQVLIDVFEQVRTILQDPSLDESSIRRKIKILLDDKFKDITLNAFANEKPEDKLIESVEDSVKLLITNIALQITIIRMFCYTDGETTNHSAANYILKCDLPDELIHNFQIDNIGELLSADKSTIQLDQYFNMELFYNKVVTKTEDTCVDFFVNRPSAVFFESPAYWRVRDALIDAKLSSGDEFLSGVPKYFFDLNSDLSKRSTNKSNFEKISNNLENELGGEFIFERGKFYFNDNNQNKRISKNLVSFGMTNLGILNALIKNNVIQKDSYVFIDEPETNLHPDWQVLMIKSLVSLAQEGVNIILNTHSTEILKYIEIAFNKIKNNEGEDTVKELLAVNYLDVDGETLEFDSDCPVEQAKEALSHLSSPFFDLYMQGQ
ncbi:ATP-binding protein [Vibrio fluvialis]|uniref:AAA family ATPase n=1 Tax=Vibrio fluvialis TaxID=676 RepID=UPI001EEB26D4|nr:AAA family ATPase [Vibrio fluvialis]EKO3480476.1 ATP-binding protein [Vibrio fluvialis]